MGYNSILLLSQHSITTRAVALYSCVRFELQYEDNINLNESNWTLLPYNSIR